MTGKWQEKDCTHSSVVSDKWEDVLCSFTVLFVRVDCLPHSVMWAGGKCLLGFHWLPYDPLSLAHGNLFSLIEPLEGPRELIISRELLLYLGPSVPTIV